MKLCKTVGRRRGIRFLMLAAGLLLTVSACDKSPSGTASTILPAPDHFRLVDITGSSPSLEFELTDATSGKTVTADNYHGKYVLVFFGYTHCPDVCPTTLVRMTRALKQLGERLAQNIQVLFVTLDPSRDTAEVLSEYVRNFGPHIAGLRGADSQVQQVANRFHVSYGYGKHDKNGDYEVIHGSAIYIFGVNGEARLMVRATDPASSISHDLRLIMDGA